ncbi:MAG: hypothetical protein QNK15_04615 [Cycloclasticus sp.]|nr:hypothetical protein [Cycloclasticus sp.]
MKLITCPKCKKKVVPSRTICPNCKTNLHADEQEQAINKNLTECRECFAQISKNANPCPICGAKQFTRTKKITIGVILFIILGYKLSFWLTEKSMEEYHQKSAVAEQAAIKKQQIEEIRQRKKKNESITNRKKMLENIKMTLTWHTVAFDTIMQANITITNNNNFTIKDIDLGCAHYSKSGTRIDTSRHTIYDTVPARTTKTFNEVDIGFINSQTEKTGCEIQQVIKHGL